MNFRLCVRDGRVMQSIVDSKTAHTTDLVSLPSPLAGSTGPAPHSAGDNTKLLSPKYLKNITFGYLPDSFGIFCSPWCCWTSFRSGMSLLGKQWAGSPSSADATSCNLVSYTEPKKEHIINTTVIVTWRVDNHHIQLFNRKPGYSLCSPRMEAADLPWRL